MKTEQEIKKKLKEVEDDVGYDSFESGICVGWEHALEWVLK